MMETSFHNITHFMGMDFVGLGDCRRTGKILTHGALDSGGELYIEAVIDQGELAGVNILDNYRISGLVKNYFYELPHKRKTNRPYQQFTAWSAFVKEGIRPSFLHRLERELAIKTGKENA